MENFIDYLSTHPVALIILAALAVLVLFFIFKKLLKLALVFALIVVALCGYYYYKAPEEFPESVKSTISDIKSTAEKMVGKGKTLTKKLDKAVERVKKATSD